MVLFAIPFSGFRSFKLEEGEYIDFFSCRLPLITIQNPEDVVAIFMSFIFATPTQLGYDPNVKRIYPQDGQEYLIFKLSDESITQEDPQTLATTKNYYFKTIKTLWECFSLCITGRTTRVWLVHQVASFENHNRLDNAPDKVLKDCWLDAKAMTEREIQRQIFKDIVDFSNDIKRAGSPSRVKFDAVTAPLDTTTFINNPFGSILKEVFENTNFKKYFLTIYCEAIGATSKGKSPSGYPWPELFTEKVSKQKPAGNTSANDTRGGGQNQSPNKSSPEKVFKDRDFVPRRQCRVVFDEVCTAIQELSSFEYTMSALKDGLVGMFTNKMIWWTYAQQVDRFSAFVFGRLDPQGCQRRQHSLVR